MPVFFMVNGCLILSKEKFTIYYYRKKVFNIVRLLIIWGGITGIFFLARDYSFRDAVWQALRCIVGRGTVPFWFVYSFIAIYTILLFAFQFIKRHIHTIVVVLGIMCVIIDGVSFFSIFIKHGYFIQAKIPQMLRLWTWLLYFCLGYYLKDKYIKIEKQKMFSLVGLGLLTGVVILFQYYLCDVYLGKINSEYLYDNICIVLWCTLIFRVVLSLEYSNIRINETVKILSANSFGVFLIHELFIQGFDLTNKISTASQATALWAGLIFVCYVISILVSKIPYIDSIMKY
jgi:surface polysaccharide O-acyltransferase-like enzyme